MQAQGMILWIPIVAAELLCHFRTRFDHIADRSSSEGSLEDCRTIGLGLSQHGTCRYARYGEYRENLAHTCASLGCPGLLGCSQLYLRRSESSHDIHLPMRQVVAAASELCGWWFPTTVARPRQQVLP